MMKTNLKNNLRFDVPFIVAFAATGIAVLLIAMGVMFNTRGVFMYPLDDPFIHMQVAKNLAFHHTWGIIPGEFASASSSLLYTLLLAAIFKIFSASAIVPFIINCIAAFFLLAVVNAWLAKQGIKTIARTFILLLLVVLIPLPVLIISGMEHTLQCLFSFLFLATFSEWLGDSERKKLPLSLVIYAVLVTALRYEGLFLVAIACLIMLFYKRFTTAIFLGIAALLPIVIFGLYSVKVGSYFLPNSVLVKSESIPFSLGGLIEFFNNIFVFKLTVVKTQGLPQGTPPPGISLLATQRLLIILPLVYLLFRQQLKQKSAYSLFLITLLLCTILHLCFASTGWFYRYEAYLVMCSVPIISVVLYKNWIIVKQDRSIFSWVFTVIILFALLFPFVLRSSAGFSKAKQSCVNIYEQQYQMAQFLKKNYSEDVIAANDIGAISYYTKATVVDLWGLGSIDVARSKKAGRWTPDFLDSLVRAKQVKLAIVYDNWFDKNLLSRWTKVAAWQVQNNVILGGDTVSFYVINKEDAAQLKQNLQNYQLPAGVLARYED